MLLKKTLSICPICKKIIEAEVVSRNNKVFMEKKCEKHGKFTGLYMWDSLNIYRGLKAVYKSDLNFQQARKIFQMPLSNTIYISVTKKCNLNCPICFAPVFVKFRRDPSIKDITKTVKKFPNIHYVVLTGGEPTVREDLPTIISTLRKMGLGVIISTNGIRFSDIEYARKLKDAGLQEIRLSLDGFDEKSDIKLRGKKLLKTKIKAIKNLQKVGLNTIFINMTLSKGVNENQIGRMMDFCIKNNITQLVLRSLLSCGLAAKTNLREISYSEILEQLSKRFSITTKDIVDYARYRFFYENFMNNFSNFVERKKICGISCEVYKDKKRYELSNRKKIFRIKFFIIFMLYNLRYFIKPLSRIFMKIEEKGRINSITRPKNKLQIFLTHSMNPLNLDLELLKSSCRQAILVNDKLYSSCVLNNVLSDYNYENV